MNARGASVMRGLRSRGLGPTPSRVPWTWPRRSDMRFIRLITRIFHPSRCDARDEYQDRDDTKDEREHWHHLIQDQQSRLHHLRAEANARRRHDD